MVTNKDKDKHSATTGSEIQRTLVITTVSVAKDFAVKLNLLL